MVEHSAPAPGHYLGKIKSFLWTAMAMLIIGAAVLVGIANLVFPYADSQRERVRTLLSERLQRPVELARLEAEWGAFGPRFYLHDLRIGEPGEAGRMHLERAEVGLDLFTWIRPGRSGMRDFRLATDQVELLRDQYGRWSLAGFGGPTPRLRGQGNLLDWLEGQAMVGLSADTLIMRDTVTGHQLTLPDLRLDFENHADHHHVSGTLGTPARGGVVSISVDIPQDRNEPTEYHLTTAGVDLADWGASLLPQLRSGLVTFELWGEQAPSEARLAGHIALRSVGITSITGEAAYQADELAAEIELAQRGPDWRAVASDVVIKRNGVLDEVERWAVARRGDRLSVRLEDFPLHEITDVVVALDGVGEELALGQLRPRGTIAKASLDRVGEQWFGQLTARELDWSPMDKIPGFGGLELDAEFDGDSARARFAIADGYVHWPSVFGSANPVEKLEGEISLAVDGGIPRLSLDAPVIEAGSLVGGLKGTMRLDGGRPSLDAALEIREGEVRDLNAWWPRNRFGEKLLTWLDRAPQQGSIESGSVILYGDLDHWPFPDGEGRFRARAELADVTLRYHPDWAPVEQLNASLDVDAMSLKVRGEGEINGFPARNLDGAIASFAEPVFTLSAQGRGESGRLLGLVSQSPVGEAHTHAFEGLEMEGPAQAQLSLEVPLRDELGEVKVRGQVDLAGVDIRSRLHELALRASNGVLSYNEGGVITRGLAGEFADGTARLDLRVGSFTQAADADLEAELNGQFSLAGLAATRAALEPLAPVLASYQPVDWSARVDIDDKRAHLRLQSQLERPLEELPAPLNEASGRLQLDLDLSEQPSYASFTAEGLGVFNAIRLDSGAWAARMAFGNDAVPGVPAGDGVSIVGEMERLDLDRWMVLADTLTATGAAPSFDFEYVDVATGELVWWGRRFGRTRASARASGAYWFLELSGEDAQGQIRLPRGEHTADRLVLAEFEQLRWPDRDLSGEGGADMRIDPATIPPLDFYAASLTVGSIDLGEVRFTSFSRGDGMHIAELESQAPSFRLDATGDWLSSNDSRFEARMSSPDLGRTLEAFGFSGIVEDGQMLAEVNGGWDGSPTDFELSRLNGALTLSLERGRITEVKPGAGRLFGLLSVQALPRRMLLDFSDFFEEGLSFDKLSGDFLLNEGEARTSNLVVVGPSADIIIIGSTDLSDQEYDQVVTVIPHVGGTLPLVGALAGGGVGAAALFIFQNMVGDAMSRAAQHYYRVRGPWEEPDVAKISETEARILLSQRVAERGPSPQD